MTIPPSCARWQQQMAASADTARILDNVIADSCLPNLEAGFFTQLAAMGHPATAADARRNTKAAVDAGFDMLTCQGGPVPPGEFSQILRVTDGKGFSYALPADTREELLDQFTVTEVELATISFDRLNDLVTAYADPGGTHAGPVSVRGRDDLAWGSDRAVFPTDLPPWAELVRQFGLPHYLGQSAGVVFQYERGEIPTPLHVPRAFDGIDFPPFLVEPDCAAPHGTTDPLEGRPARPEAVHRGCQIAKDRVILKAWR